MRVAQRARELVRVEYYRTITRYDLRGPLVSTLESLVLASAKLVAIQGVLKWDDEGGPLENYDTDVAHAAMMYAVAVIIEMKESEL